VWRIFFRKHFPSSKKTWNQQRGKSFLSLSAKVASFPTIKFRRVTAVLSSLVAPFATKENKAQDSRKSTARDDSNLIFSLS